MSEEPDAGHEKRVGAWDDPERSRRRVGRVVLGSALTVVAVALVAAGAWLNQPGFAGDPRVKLLEDDQFALVLVVAVALAIKGWLTAWRG